MFYKYLPDTLNLHNVGFWIDGFGIADRKTKVSYTYTDVTQGANILSGRTLSFNGVSSKISVGDTNADIKCILMWVKPETSNSYFIDLDGSASITITNDTLTATGWTSPTIYIDDEEETAISTDRWSLVTVMSDTAIDANTVIVGKVGSDYYEGDITQIIGLTKTLTPEEIGWIYNTFKLTSGINYLLLENGDFLLQEDYDKIIL